MYGLSVKYHHRPCSKWLSMILWIGISILVVLDVTQATWNPHLHPLHGQQPLSSWQETYQDDQQIHPEQDDWRGGSTAVTNIRSPPPTEVELESHEELQLDQPPQAADEPFQPPKVHLKQVSTALRLTAEWNRRISDGINKMKSWGRGRRLDVHSQRQEEHLKNERDNYGGPYGDLPVNVHPSRAWQPPIPASKSDHSEGEELTVFHAKTPPKEENVKSSRGIAYWGPDLEEMLQSAVSSLQLTEERVEIPLAIIYLDRASSAETPRGNDVVACPFCTPRTVHRLFVASLWLALEAVQGSAGVQQMRNAMFPTSNDNASSSFLMEITEEELREMVAWMRSALGVNGLMVTVDEMKVWTARWQAAFRPKTALVPSSTVTNALE